MTFQLSSNDWGACSKLTCLDFATLLYECTILYMLSQVTLCNTFMFTLYIVIDINQTLNTDSFHACISYRLHVPSLSYMAVTKQY